MVIHVCACLHAQKFCMKTLLIWSYGSIKSIGRLVYASSVIVNIITVGQKVVWPWPY